MSKLFSSRQIIRTLLHFGFVFVSQRGSHAKYRKILNIETRTVIVPADKKEIPLGTFHSICRQAKLDPHLFSDD